MQLEAAGGAATTRGMCLMGLVFPEPCGALPDRVTDPLGSSALETGIHMQRNKRVKGQIAFFSIFLFFS